MPEGKIIRRPLRFERDFAQLPNRWLRDNRLSYRARGLLGMLMSHDSGFRVTLKSIAADSPSEGLDAVRSAVRELEEFGYLIRRPATRGGRFEGDDWELCDPRETVDNPLWGGDNSDRAGDNPRATALDEPTRTALDNPTREEHYEKTPSKTPKVTPGRARELALLAPWAPCPDGAHRWLEGGSWCDACGLHRSGDSRIVFESGKVIPVPGG